MDGHLGNIDYRAKENGHRYASRARDEAPKGDTVPFSSLRSDRTELRLVG
jgi:hypothetical protein